VVEEAMAVATHALIGGGVLLLSAAVGAPVASGEWTESSRVSLSEVSSPGQQSVAVLTAQQELPGLIRRAMQRTGVPGVAVAVVHRDRLTYKRGFGVRSTKTEKRVRPKTVFQIASLSKPVGASAVAAAVGDGDVRWQDPVAARLPDFQLSNPAIGERVTIGDLYAHRSGLPGGAGNDLESFGFPRSEILARLHHEPLNPFRITYEYSNFGMTAAGEAVSRAAGADWADFTKKRLLRKLKMRRSSFNYADFRSHKNRAALHQEINGRWRAAVKRNPDPQSPAGGASSTVLDLARWMRTLLAQGEFRDKQVIARRPLRKMLSPQIYLQAPHGDPMSFKAYGYGMNVETDDTGRVRWAHSGAFSDGAATRAVMVPDLDVGIVVLSNGWPVGLAETVADEFLDLVEFGEVRGDRLPDYRSRFAGLLAADHTLNDQPLPERPTSPRDLAGYVGTYYNDYVGTVRVTEKSGSLLLRVGPSGDTVLRLRHFDEDMFFHNEIRMPKGAWSAVEFSGVGPQGEATTIDLAAINSHLGNLARVTDS
jgi:CubicO group peptidase (beta-lactamase class C family)